LTIFFELISQSIIFTKKIMAIQIVQQAPDFTLRDTDKNKVTLSDHKGKSVLLLFFPLAFTSTCTKELCMTRDSLSTYNNLNTTVFGISVDSLFSLNRYKEEQALNFVLLSDFNKTASTAYGCLYDHFFNDMDGVSKRSAFVIDAAGIVQYAEVLENAGDIPNFDAIVDCLKHINK
jgi:glutaredoxin-dependent peroxiredoxin